MGKGTFDEIGSSRVTLKWFSLMVLSSQVVGVIAIILLAVLFGQYRGGFSWTSDVEKEFNYHPLFMTLGMIFFYGDAILAYRVFRDVKKLRVKILHGSLLALSLIFASIGLKAVFDNHNLSTPPKPNLYSLHSWVGLTAVVLFGAQWVCGFVSFLFPKLSEEIRKAYMPSHKFWGKAIFTLAVGAVLMGITEYSIFKNIYNTAEIKYQRNLINFFGGFVIIFAGIILYLVGNPGYQRPPDNEIEHVPLAD
ncbi:unnamed protein product [Rotaria socialis]|uniref:Cytochrome b561 domain-containing protein n=1 Tax=Rotaria socialis TaxID=392032 RepID=A0A817YBD3_9BILA|nr:unnamed protein product [Rotaria socialis]CAF3376808.1 unnamed protein product [Rotaria socialis]CAF3439025.1 unnamed protein product [Rotaria socialis]CAF3535342.1 unnamed protein product [Rotaria socialis]CAF3664202.1 unnamed protein product [Rotaria socialis]